MVNVSKGLNCSIECCGWVCSLFQRFAGAQWSSLQVQSLLIEGADVRRSCSWAEEMQVVVEKPGSGS